MRLSRIRNWGFTLLILGWALVIFYSDFAGDPGADTLPIGIVGAVLFASGFVVTARWLFLRWKGRKNNS